MSLALFTHADNRNKGRTQDVHEKAPQQTRETRLADVHVDG